MSSPSNLVIVESPAKAKTIERFLGPDYKVMSSYGHIRDLKKRSLSIDIDNDFAPVYEIPEDKENLVNELRKAAAKAKIVWLASDEDREGEAIAWHLYEVLGLKPETTRRIVFHEITKRAILEAIAHPRQIDLARVDAQQARRVLDRIVGFELSPVLWKRLRPSLSAGRVQSVAVRLIVEREEEIRRFVSESFYRLTATFRGADGHTVRAEMNERIDTRDDARRLLEACSRAAFSVGNIERKEFTKSPAPPFTTSTLQQEAARKLGFTVAQTMSVAQQLYENGHITYMRTDSVNLSEEALHAMAELITDRLGAEYHKRRTFHTSSKGAQEAHEAIRPTYVEVEVIDDATPQQQKLYTLIRRRAMASQMADATLERTTVDILGSDIEHPFKATDERVLFPGFLHMYIESTDDETDAEPTSQNMGLQEGMPLTYDKIDATERFTQQPPRYSEASLIKKMEELGIGRPATWAPTITTIFAREFVRKGDDEGTPREYDNLSLADGHITESRSTTLTGGNKGRLVPTDTGIVVNEFLTEYFPDILDYNFTANIEEKFDLIARGQLPWSDEIARFYALFHPAVDNASTINQGLKFGERVLGTDPEGRVVSVKIGRFGPVVQIGSSDDEEKPRFASLLKGQSMGDITLEEALKLFEFPRTLGKYEDVDVQVGFGRFGPYVRHGSKFVSLPKDSEPATVTFEQAVELIEAKRAAEAQKVLKTFAEDEEVQILNGRFGPYIAYRKKNYRLPKGSVPADVTYEQAMEIIRQADAAPAKPARRKTKK